jgi:hypothetical protein
MTVKIKKKKQIEDNEYKIKYILIKIICSRNRLQRHRFIRHLAYTVRYSDVPINSCRSQWPRRLRRRSAAERLPRLWVRIPPGAWMFVCCTVFVFSGRGLYDGPIHRSEELYRVWCVLECDQVKIQTLYPYCKQVSRRGKHYERKRNETKTINPSPLKITLGLHSSVITTLVYNNTKYSVPFMSL